MAFASFLGPVGGLSEGASGFEDVEEAVEEGGGVDDGFDEEEAAAGVGVVRQGEERVPEVAVAMEALGAGNEPEVELVLDGAEIGEELGVVALGVVDEVAGVDLEEFASRRRVGLVRCGRAPLSIWER